MNYGVYDPTYAAQSHAARPGAYPIVPYPQYGMSTGAADATKPSTTDEVKTWLAKPSVASIPNGWWLFGAAAFTGIWYANKKGVFGKK